MRVAIVGCGRISNAHIGALQTIENAEIVAVCDRDPWRARDVTEFTKGARAYNDLAPMLQQERPNAVHILTPPKTHAELAIQAMEAGCHVLVEKPMALSVQEADAMIAAAQKNGVKLCANHNYLFKPSIAKARELVESGAIGELVYVDSYYGLAGEGGSYGGGSARSHWAWHLPGGVFTNFVPHLIYLQTAFLQDICSVAGVTVSQADRPDAPMSELTVLLQGATAAGVMTVSMRAKPYAKFVDVYGTKGIIHADLVREVCTVNKDWHLPRVLSKVVFSMEDSIQLASGTVANTAKVVLGRLRNMPGLQVLLREFYKSIRNDTDSPVPGEDGREVAGIMEMIWARSDKLSSSPKPVPVQPAREEPKTNAERTIAGSKALSGKVLVTGATGFLGRRLVSALLRIGTDIVVLARDPNRVPPELDQQVKVIYGDLRDPASVEAAMRGVDIVFHCAAITTNKARWTVHEDINIRGSETVFNEALKAGVKRVVHVSSVLVYGLRRPPHGRPFKESDSYAPHSDKWAHYMRSKIEAEKLAFKLWQEHKLPVTVIRFGILYGPGEGRSPGIGLAKLGPMRLTIGTGHNTMPYTFIDNAVDALLLTPVCPDAIGEAFNVVDEPQVTKREVAQRSMELIGERSRLIPVPPFLLSSVALLFELTSGMHGSGKPPRISRHLVRGAHRDVQYNTTKARDQLHWQPEITLEEGLRKTFGVEAP